MTRRPICKQPDDQPCLTYGQRGPCRHCSDMSAHSERMKARHADPEFAKAHSERMKALNADPEFAKANSERMKARHAKNISWCPDDKTEDYRTLKKHGYSASEARAMIEASL